MNADSSAAPGHSGEGAPGRRPPAAGRPEEIRCATIIMLQRTKSAQPLYAHGCAGQFCLELCTPSCAASEQCVLAGSHVSPRQGQTPRPGVSAPSGSSSSSSALLQEQLERAAKAAETAVFRAAEAESCTTALSAELQATQKAEQARPPDLDIAAPLQGP